MQNQTDNIPPMLDASASPPQRKKLTLVEAIIGMVLMASCVIGITAIYAQRSHSLQGGKLHAIRVQRRHRGICENNIRLRIKCDLLDAQQGKAFALVDDGKFGLSDSALQRLRDVAGEAEHDGHWSAVADTCERKRTLKFNSNAPHQPKPGWPEFRQEAICYSQRADRM